MKMLMYDLTSKVSTANYNGVIIPIYFLKINYGANRRTLSQSVQTNTYGCRGVARPTSKVRKSVCTGLCA